KHRGPEHRSALRQLRALNKSSLLAARFRQIAPHLSAKAEAVASCPICAASRLLLLLNSELLGPDACYSADALERSDRDLQAALRVVPAQALGRRQETLRTPLRFLQHGIGEVLDTLA